MKVSVSVAHSYVVEGMNAIPLEKAKAVAAMGSVAVGAWTGSPGLLRCANVRHPDRCLLAREELGSYIREGQLVRGGHGASATLGNVSADYGRCNEGVSCGKRIAMPFTTA